MSGEKKRHRWRRSPILIEEKTKIDSKSVKTKTTTEEEKHTENTVRKWYNNNNNGDDDDDDDDDASNQSENQPTQQLPNATIANKIERVLRKINAWTNESVSASTNNSDNNIQRETLQDTAFNETNLSAYDNIHHKQENKSRSKKATSHKSLDSVRQRCSSTHAEPNMIKNQQISNDRPYSMTFANEPLSSMKINDNINYTCGGFNRKKKTPDSKVQFSSFRQKQSFGKHPVLINLLDNNKTQRQSLYSQHTNLAPLSSMYGSDFFYPPTTTTEEIEQQQQ
ncbi:unnamed protein product, partial [Rotaria socialis]